MCQVAGGAAPIPTMHDTYQVYASRGNIDDYLGTSEYCDPRSSCFPACLVFIEARTLGKTIGKDHGGLPDRTKVCLVCSHMATLGCATQSPRYSDRGFF